MTNKYFVVALPTDSAFNSMKIEGQNLLKNEMSRIPYGSLVFPRKSHGCTSVGWLDCHSIRWQVVRGGSSWSWRNWRWCKRLLHASFLKECNHVEETKPTRRAVGSVSLDSCHYRASILPWKDEQAVQGEQWYCSTWNGWASRQKERACTRVK